MLYYGLTYNWGIVTANQETTTNSWTNLGTKGIDGSSEPRYYVGTSDKTLHLDMKTGLAGFGHLYKVWYNADDPAYAQEVYAAYDNAALPSTARS